MSRSRKEILASKKRIRDAISMLNLELAALAEQERDFEMVPLTDRFFWESVAGVLRAHKPGLSSTALRSLVNSQIPARNFRTFLSRLKSKGYVEAVGSSKTKNWKLSSSGEKLYDARKDRK